MVAASTAELIARMRRTGAEPSWVEVKAAVGGVPRTLTHTLSAFANADGGVVLLGVDEAAGFAPAPGFDADAIRDAAAGAAADRLTPPVRCEIEIEMLDGRRIVRMDIAGLDAVERPCYVTTAGLYGGSYIRGGDGDRHLSHYEVSQLLLNQRQPVFDAEPVPQATPDDLDPELVAGLLATVGGRHPRSVTGVPRNEALKRLRVLTEHDDRDVPTLAGLITLGIYPQQFFPQLFVSFVALPGLTMGETLPDGTRFLDNANCDGPLPSVVDQAVAAVQRNMTRAAVIEGVGRRDRYEYPLDVVRELVVNAVMHRDYSPQSRGSQVQVELYPDRLVVRSPGGLYGAVEVGQLGGPGVSSSRNETLARLLAEVPLPATGRAVCENRGSGIPSVMNSLRSAGMSPPDFDTDLLRVQVTVPRHALLDERTIAWLDGLGRPGLTEQQRLALAMMRRGESVSNETLRAWGLHRTDATNALTGLVALGLVERHGGRRYARYRLTDQPAGAQLALDLPSPINVPTSVEAVLAVAGSHSAKEIMQRTGLTYPVVLSRLNKLIDDGVVEPTAPPRSRHRRYRLIADHDSDAMRTETHP